jgi:hydroxypyruvate isomerase
MLRMRFEPNISILLTELPLLERPAAAAELGFEAAELWWPFAEPDPGAARVDELARSFEDAGLTLACLNFFAGDLTAGERGALSVPRLRDALHANIPVAVGLAARLGCRRINALYGNDDGVIDPAKARALALDNLTMAAAAAGTVGATVVIEPVNPVEFPAYGLPRADDVVGFLDEAHEQRGVEARCSFDLYHAGMAGDDLEGIIERHAARIGHVQIADVPGRGAPGTGAIDFDRLLERLRRRGYEGWVGLEYVPDGDSRQSLARTMEALSAHEGTGHRA